MARRERISSDERVRRGVARTVSNVLAVLVFTGVLGAWGWLGVYRLDPGEAAVILQFGRYVGTESREGLRWHLPPPIQRIVRVNVESVLRTEFGGRSGGEGELAVEASVQTADNNIVELNFVVQTKVLRAYEHRYRVADVEAILNDAAQAAVREVVGRNTIDDVLSERRPEIEAESAGVLQRTLDRYEAGLAVLRVQLQDVQPPSAVRGAFDDVIAAEQDRNRKVNEAEGYRNEVLPRAQAEAAELVEEALGYKESKIAEAEGEAQRFLALATEYRKAPDVTRERLYLETMEDVLPNVEKVIIEPGTGTLLPYLPLGAGASPPVPGAPR